MKWFLFSYDAGSLLIRAVNLRDAIRRLAKGLNGSESWPGDWRDYIDDLRNGYWTVTNPQTVTKRRRE